MGSTDTDIDDLENATYKYLIGEQTEKMWQRLKGIKGQLSAAKTTCSETMIISPPKFTSGLGTDETSLSPRAISSLLTERENSVSKSSCVHDSWAKQVLLLIAKQGRGPGSITTETGFSKEENTWTECSHTLKSRNCKELLSGLFGGPAVSVLRLSLAPRQILTIETVKGAAFVSKGERRITGFTINIQGTYSTGRGLGSIQKQSCFERQHVRSTGKQGTGPAANGRGISEDAQ
ncbi:hypothetical protein ACRRTK_024089 [Alexandromys fortis]